MGAILKKVISLVCIIFVINSCNQNNYYEEIVPLNDHWSKNEIKTFELPVKEKGASFDLFFVLRNNNKYEYSNIYLFAELISPKGEKLKDTLEYQLAYPNGKWIGSGMSNVKQNTLIYKEKLATQDTGIYRVNVVQAMRKNDLKGLEDISLLVEKRNLNNE